MENMLILEHYFGKTEAYAFTLRFSSAAVQRKMLADSDFPPFIIMLRCAA
jgi:hypothetical protein